MERFSPRRSPDRDYFHRDRGDFGHHDEGQARRYMDRRSDHDGNRGPDSNAEQVEGTLYFSDCMLVPPREGIDKPLPAIKPKPPGCKTIFVGGIPDPLRHSMKRVETIMAEVFTTNGGEIDTIRLNDRGFCHIRFVREDSVDMAMSVAGYFMIVAPVRFRLIVDYSQSRGDAEDYEARRTLAEKLNLTTVPSIASIPRFGGYVIDEIMTDLKDKNKYEESVIIVRSWLDSGFMTSQNASKFFAMCQVSFSQVRRLVSEKEDLDTEFKEVKARYSQNLTQMDAQFQHLINLYEDTQKKRCWDIFTRGQRKSIENWLAQAKEGRTSITKKGKKKEKGEADMEINKNEETVAKSRWSSSSWPNGSDNIVKQEAQAKQQPPNSDEKDQKIASLEALLQELRKQVWDMVEKLQLKDAELQENQNEIQYLKEQVETAETQTVAKSKKRKLSTDGAASFVLEGSDAKVLSGIATFLQAYPNGTSLGNIEAYLKEVGLSRNVANVEEFLSKFPQVFAEVGSNFADGQSQNRWKTIFLSSAMM